MSFSRRDLFRGALQRGQHAAARIVTAGRDSIASKGSQPKNDHSLTLLQRPPGAVAEGQFLAACTRCGDCATACPPQAIVLAGDDYGPQRAGTPMILAGENACVMCTSLPCITACEPGVLQMELPVHMAEVAIHEGGCLSWQGEACRVCSDACPVENAIALDAGGRPRIDPAACTGCGTCLQVCPVGDEGVVFEPAQARPFYPLDK
jgi:ferredoxin-type protein NapG